VIYHRLQLRQKIKSRKIENEHCGQTKTTSKGKVCVSLWFAARTFSPFGVDHYQSVF
jgi:hypothetical protein